MLNSIFKKKISPELYAEQKEAQNLQPIQYTYYDEEENSMTSKALYFQPKHTIPIKTFNPHEWNINKFQIGKHLGRGKYGHVYLARQRETKHIVALKVLSKKQLKNQDVVNQVRRELQIHSHLQHKNILQFNGFFFDDRKIYIIMEYATEGQLYAILKKKGKFDQGKAATYTAHMLQAMQYIHKLNIIHRDLKPENILICQDNTAKLTDFGWSVHTSKSRKTYCGTIDYLCPEIINRRPYTTELDTWTIGVLAYELASGKAPFESSSRSQTSKKIKNIQYSVPSHFSPDLINFLQKMLTTPQGRMSEAEALQHPWIIKNRLN